MKVYWIILSEYRHTCQNIGFIFIDQIRLVGFV